MQCTFQSAGLHSPLTELQGKHSAVMHFDKKLHFKKKFFLLKIIIFFKIKKKIFFRVFEVHKANDRFQKFYPLTKEYGIIQLFHHFTSYFQCVKLNWNTQTYQLGKATSDEVLNNLTLVLPDRCYNLASTFIGFLITNYDSFQYCQFAVHQLEVLRTGHIYEIDANTNCLDFSKNIVSAVNHSATEIKQFNVVLGEVVRTIDITGLPQELRFSNGVSQTFYIVQWLELVAFLLCRKGMLIVPHGLDRLQFALSATVSKKSKNIFCC